MSAIEYQRKKALAAKGEYISITISYSILQTFSDFLFFSAMQTKPVPEILRVPSSLWQGYGFSHSSPSAALKEQFKREGLILVS